VERGEANYQNGEAALGVTRRVLFSFLTKDKKELIEAVKAEGEGFLEVVEASNVNIEYLESIISMMKSARNRLLAVLGEEGECPAK